MKRFLLCIVLICIAGLLSAEVVYLKNGSVLKGTIEKIENDSLVIKTDQGDITVMKADIDKIDYEKPGEEKKIMAAALYTNVLTTILNPIISQTTSINMGLKGALGNIFIYDIATAFLYNTQYMLAGSGIAITGAFNLFGNYLNGLYIGASFSLIGYFVPLSIIKIPAFVGIGGGIGYQYAFDFGLFIGAYFGYGFIMPPYSLWSPSYGVEIGVAFPYTKQKK